MRTIAFVAIIASSCYAGLVIVPDFLGATIADLIDPVQMLARLYLLAIFLLSLSLLQKPARSSRSRLAIRGVLEGAVIAYLLIAVICFLRVSDHETDARFHWVVLYATLGALGPLFSAIGAAAYVYFPSMAHMD
jgi:hypothetical protein